MKAFHTRAFQEPIPSCNSTQLISQESQAMISASLFIVPVWVLALIIQISNRTHLIVPFSFFCWFHASQNGNVWVSSSAKYLACTEIFIHNVEANMEAFANWLRFEKITQNLPYLICMFCGLIVVALVLIFLFFFN